MSDLLFGRFVGQSKLKQGAERIVLTPDAAGGTGSPSPLLPALEMEGTFGIVSGTLVDGTLFGAEILETLPAIHSGVVDMLLSEGTIDAESLLPKIQKSLKRLVGTPAKPPEGAPVCALIVGHRKSAKGAVSKDGDVNEFDFNSDLANEIQKRVRRAKVEIVFRDNSENGYNKLPGKVNKVGANFIVSLHLNAVATRSAGGTETLYYHSSSKGHTLAKIVQRHLLKALELRDRHTKARNDADRGAHLLKHTKAPCVIAEPFFISNPDELKLALKRKVALAKAYAAAIDEAAKELAA